VMARTGHRSSQMVNRYRRIATSFAELNLGELMPLDVAIPELAQVVRPQSDLPKSIRARAADGALGAYLRAFADAFAPRAAPLR
jgi:hypothetical protein